MYHPLYEFWGILEIPIFVIYLNSSHYVTPRSSIGCVLINAVMNP